MLFNIGHYLLFIHLIREADPRFGSPNVFNHHLIVLVRQFVVLFHLSFGPVARLRLQAATRFPRLYLYTRSRSFNGDEAIGRDRFTRPCRRGE